MISKPWEEYVKAVKSGQRNAGKLERLGVEHALALRRRFDFDESEVERVMNIIHLCRHTKGKWYGKRFNLLPHQAFFIAYLFGLKGKDGFRVIREAMINMAKKGGKSELDGLVAFIMTFWDGEPTAEGYIVANKTEQAMFCWKSAKSIVNQFKNDFPEFAPRVKIYDNQQKHIIEDLATQSYFKTLPYENNTLDGVMPHIAIIDEFHEYPTTEVPDNLSSGTVLRNQPLLLYSTTRGFHPFGPLAEKEEYYTNVLTGLIDDPRVFPLIYSMDNEANWENRNFWIQCNPGIDHGLPHYSVLEEAVKKANHEGGHTRAATMIKNFNIWQRGRSVFIEPEVWDAGSDPIDMASLSGRECYGAFDIGQTNDLSAFGLLFPPLDDGDRFTFLLKCFLPEMLIEKLSREHKVVYSQWVYEGWVETTPGNFIDLRAMESVINASLEEYKLKLMYADQAFAKELITALSERGVNIESFPQTYSYMNEPIIKLQGLANSGLIHHGGNKVLSWMISNVDLKKDGGGRVMMDKSDRVTGHGKDHKKGRKKIDGAVVLAMCLAAYIRSEVDANESKYNNETIYIG